MKRGILTTLNARIEWETFWSLKREAKVKRVSLSALVRQILRASLPESSSHPSAASESSERETAPPPSQPSPKLPSSPDQAEERRS